MKIKLKIIKQVLLAVLIVSNGLSLVNGMEKANVPNQQKQSGKKKTSFSLSKYSASEDPLFSNQKKEEEYKAPITIDDASLIDFLKKHPDLETIDLFGCSNITNTSIKKVWNCCKGLKKINCGYTQVTDEGFEGIVACKKIKKIFLDSTAVTHGGVKCMLKQCTTIREVSLKQNPQFRDDNVDCLFELNGQVKKAWLLGTKVTEKRKRSIRLKKAISVDGISGV